MKRYMIVEDERLCELESKVRELLKKGWEPQGGIAVVPATFTPGRLLQAMAHRNLSDDGEGKV